MFRMEFQGTKQSLMQYSIAHNSCEHYRICANPTHSTKTKWPLYSHTYHAKCVKTESTDTAITSVLIFLNSSTLSLNAIISVGQTNVLQ